MRISKLCVACQKGIFCEILLLPSSSSSSREPSDSSSSDGYLNVLRSLAVSITTTVEGFCGLLTVFGKEPRYCRRDNRGLLPHNSRLRKLSSGQGIYAGPPQANRIHQRKSFDDWTPYYSTLPSTSKLVVAYPPIRPNMILRPLQRQALASPSQSTSALFRVASPRLPTQPFRSSSIQRHAATDVVRPDYIPAPNE